MPQPDREVRGLRNDLREVCAALDGRLAQLLEAVGKTNVLAEDLEKNLLGILNEKNEVPVNIAGQAGPLQTEVAEGTVAVSNPTDVAGVEAAVNDNSETFNTNVWAIFGIVVGFGALAVFWKLVRP